MRGDRRRTEGVEIRAVGGPSQVKEGTVIEISRSAGGKQTVQASMRPYRGYR